jgi:protein required for attachment to host cells
VTNKLLFVLADGGRARFVKRTPSTGHFVTLEEIDRTSALARLRAELRASPPSSTHASASPRRSAVGEEDFIRPAKEAFMAEVAQRALALVRERELDGVFLAAPPPLIGRLRACLDGQAPLAGAIRKDLTKTPDHDLGAWLGGIHTSLPLSL